MKAKTKTVKMMLNQSVADQTCPTGKGVDHRYDDAADSPNSGPPKYLRKKLCQHIHPGMQTEPLRNF